MINWVNTTVFLFGAICLLVSLEFMSKYNSTVYAVIACGMGLVCWFVVAEDILLNITKKGDR